MFCFVRSYEFFLILGGSVFVALAMAVAFVVRANIEESGSTQGAARTLFTLKTNRLLENHGFFSDRGYFNPKARLFLRLARRSWLVALAFMLTAFGFAGLIVFANICRAG